MVTGSDANKVVNVEFEVFGQVQGCMFTKYAKETADSLGIMGWIKNKKTGTIIGRIQGHKESVDQMVQWLSETGSPGSKVEKCQLSNWQNIARPDYNKFSLKF
ncbi:acylphosphatase-2-like [Oratosquilla oratoria]|uniref:acylphosphatase-2-like n=1 Tax=Oratosquilla oratoria TaxID=337810 RepID=UPI003F763554